MCMIEVLFILGYMLIAAEVILVVISMYLDNCLEVISSLALFSLLLKLSVFSIGSLEFSNFSIRESAFAQDVSSIAHIAIKAMINF